MFDNIAGYDNHSSHEAIESFPPTDFHQEIFRHAIVCFPDNGALTRYEASFQGWPMIYCDKIRNQDTGEITGLSLQTMGVDIAGKSVLIVDDICDGGRTFIEVAKLLKDASRVDLAVTHGIFSKGFGCLYEAGIDRIFTTNSLNRMQRYVKEYQNDSFNVAYGGEVHQVYVYNIIDLDDKIDYNDIRKVAYDVG